MIGDTLGEPPRAVRMIGTTADVTERKHVEEALRLADVQKDEFLAMQAHNTGGGNG